MGEHLLGIFKILGKIPGTFSISKRKCTTIVTFIVSLKNKTQELNIRDRE